jgi:hypothetical protein
MFMNTGQEVKATEDFKAQLRLQGRSVNWLVAQLNTKRAVSRGYVSGLLNGRHPMTEEWARQFREAIEGSFSLE